MTVRFALGPATALVDPDGVPIEPLEIEADAAEFLDPELHFEEGADDGKRPLMACCTRWRGESGAGRLMSASGSTSGSWTV